MENPGRFIRGHHHITLGVGDAQQDYEFHTRILGLKSVKKTLFYDGTVPIYHLYYGNDLGDEGSLVTTFPMAKTGVKATPGSGQISCLSLSVPPTSLDFWKDRLEDHGFGVAEGERFGERQLEIRSPANIRYAFVGVEEDSRKVRSDGPVPADHRIRGTHSIAVSTRDVEFMSDFMTMAWGSQERAQDGAVRRYEVGDGKTGTFIDLEVEPDRKAGSWHLGEGVVHHMAFQVETREQQDELKFYIEGLGFTDCSDVKDRGYFDSVYVRTPSGALFEAAVSHDDGFLCDEEASQLGSEVKVSPQLEGTKDDLIDVIGRLVD